MGRVTRGENDWRMLSTERKVAEVAEAFEVENTSRWLLRILCCGRKEGVETWNFLAETSSILRIASAVLRM